MIGHAAAQALTVAGSSAFVAGEMLSAARNRDNIPAVAGQCVGPLLHAALIAIEVSGMMKQESTAAVHDVLADYLNVLGGGAEIIDITAAQVMDECASVRTS